MKEASWVLPGVKLHERPRGNHLSLEKGSLRFAPIAPVDLGWLDVRGDGLNPRVDDGV
jgi:hypothetical protein